MTNFLVFLTIIQFNGICSFECSINEKNKEKDIQLLFLSLL